MIDKKNLPPPSHAELFGSFLSALLKRPEVKGVGFKGKEVKLDGYRFISWRFDGCKLIVTSTNFELVNCYIGEDTAISYGPDIIKPIQLFNARYSWICDKMPAFAPKRNPDGTITIGG